MTRIPSEDNLTGPHSNRTLMLAAVLLLGSIGTGIASAQATESNADVFNSDGVEIRYVDRGSGEPVLLIHGFSSRLEYWEAAGIAGGLNAAGFRVIAYDARGHGNSGKPHDPGQYGVEKDVEDVVRLLDHLSIERAHVVGYSRGSKIASQFLARQPTRIRSVVFGGWGVGNPVETLSQEDCLATADSLARGAFPTPLVRALHPNGAPLPSAEEQAVLMKQLSALNDMKALAAAFSSQCDETPVTATALLATEVPVLAIVGALDGMAPSVEAMAREMSDALDVVVIADADHYTAVLHPQFLARLVSFLTDPRHEPR
jgi:pimeloyl-ACP methyl ester carboxylesterase